MRVILFNLYPYRALREQKRRQRVLAELFAGVAVGLLLCFLISKEFSDRAAKKERFLSNLSAMKSEVAARVSEVQAKKDRLTVLERQIGTLRAIEKESILASSWVSFLDGTVPPQVFITRLSAAKDALTITGTTDAVSSLASWIDQMEGGNHLFRSADLITLTEPANARKDEKGGRRHQFEIKVSLRGASDESK